MSNFYLKFSVEGMTLTRTYCPAIIDGTNRFIHAKFKFGDGWDELTKYLFVARNNETYSVLMESDECVIDYHAIATVGQFDMQVVGVKDDVRAVTNAITLKVKTSEMQNNPSGEETRFTNDFITTSLEEIRKLKLDTEDIKSVAEEYSEQAGAYSELAKEYSDLAEGYSESAKGYSEQAGEHEETVKRIVGEIPQTIDKAVEVATRIAGEFADESKKSAEESNASADRSQQIADGIEEKVNQATSDAVRRAEQFANQSQESANNAQQIVEQATNDAIRKAEEFADKSEEYANNSKASENVAKQISDELPQRINNYVDTFRPQLKGEDGKSVTVQQVSNGAKVTDGFGNSVTVTNGVNGKDGVDGKDSDVNKAYVDEQISQQSDEIVQIQSVVKPSPNLFIADIRPNTNINNSTGVFTETTSNQNTVATETMIRVIAGEKYTISCNSANFSPPIWVYYGNNKEFKGLNNSGVYTTVIPNDVSYLRFKWNRTGQTQQMASAFNHNVQLELGGVATDFVLPFQASLKDNVVDTKNIINQSVTVEKLTIVEQTKNIFDYDDFKPRYALNNQGDRKPIISSDVKYGCSIKGISVVSGATYTVTKYFKDTKSIPYGFVYEYDVDDNFIQRQNVSNGTTITLSNETKYIRVQESSESGTDMLERFPYLIYQLEMGNVQTEFTYPKIVKEQYLPISSVKDSDATKQLSDINEQIDIQRPKIIKRNTKEFVNFGFVTDTHLEGIDGNRTGLVDIKTINEIGAENWLDFVVHCGDIFNSYESGSVNGSQGITFDKALQRIDDALSGFKNIRVPIFIARGNHDVNDKFKPNYPSDVVDKTQHITQEQFKLLCQNQFRQNVNGEYKCSFYKDFDDKKVRVIVFDVYINDNQSPAFSNYSLNWLANTALKLDNKNDYSVLLIAHTFEGSVLNTLNDLIGAFKNGGTFTNSALNVSANYSSQGACDFIGCICGHTHADNQTNENGYWYLTSGTSYLKTDINLKSNIYANVYTIDTDNHILYKQKLGANRNSYAYNWRDLTYTQV